MSYILDALRKADAERDRGHVPNLHAQSAFGSAASGTRRPAGRPWPWVLAASSGLIAAGALGWVWFGGVREGTASGPENRVAVVASSTVPMNSAPPPVAGPSTQAPTTTVPVPAVQTPIATSSSPVPAVTPTSKPAPTRSANTSPNPAPASRPRAEATSTPPAAPTGTGTATADRIYTLAELPDDLRRELPALAVGGSMYSPTPAARLLIVNGQVVHEGDTVAPGLVLRQIRLKSAVLSFRDHRFEIRY